MLVLAQTAPDQAEGIRTRVDRNLVSREQVGKGTDVVLVSVGEHHAVQLAAGLEIGEIGNDDVDAQMFFAREHHAGVHDETVVAEVIHHEVHPELAETAEGDEPELARVGQAILAPPRGKGAGLNDRRSGL
jgi:hypothetical protein